MTAPNSKYAEYKRHCDAGLSVDETAAAMGILPATVRQYARENKLPYRGLVFFNPAVRPMPKKRDGVVVWERRAEFGHVNRVSLVAIPGVQIGSAS